MIASMLTLRRAAIFLFVLGIFAASAIAEESPPTQTTPGLTPQQMYLRSVRAMKDVPQPAFVTFRENVTGRNIIVKCTNKDMAISAHHGDFKASYDVTYRSSDGRAMSEPVGQDNATSCPAAILDPLGAAAISAFGSPRVSPSPGSAPTSAPSDALQTIGAVRAESSRFYHIAFVGREQHDEHDVYHLKLRAFRDPNEHPLTDLYIDCETFLVRESRGEAAAHYVVASGRASGIVDFDRVGPYWLVKHESFAIAANALLVHVNMTISIDGSNFRTPSTLPGVVFPEPQSKLPPNPTPSSTR